MTGETFSEYTFDDLEICKDLKRSLEKIGFHQMTPIQAQAIPELLKGKDIIGQAQTGTGKTAAFGVPLLNMIDPDSKKLQAIILCPTRELAMQVCSEIRNFTVYMQNVKLLPVYGGQNIEQQIRGLHGTQIIVGTPGRVMDHMRRHTIKMDDVKFCILDEADEMLQMGFREDMEVILGAIDHPHQTCLFSATMPQEILDITERFQTEPTLIKVTPQELTIDTVEQFYYPVKREYKTEALIRLLAYYQYNKSIIFCNTKSMADELATTLKNNGYQAETLHGDLAQKQRDVVMGNFRTGATNILVATDIAARGIDVDDVEAVFNYDIPSETEYYVHRIGRTGRAGKTGTAHTFCKSREFNRIREIEALCHTHMTEKQIPSSNSINDAKIKKVLHEVQNSISEETTASYGGIITGYCKKYEIPLEDFMAAFFKMAVGDMVEEIEISLPEKKEKRGRRDHGHGRREEGHRFGRRSDDDERKRGEHRERHSHDEHGDTEKRPKRHDHSKHREKDNKDFPDA